MLEVFVTTNLNCISDVWLLYSAQEGFVTSLPSFVLLRVACVAYLFKLTTGWDVSMVLLGSSSVAAYRNILTCFCVCTSPIIICPPGYNFFKKTSTVLMFGGPPFFEKF